MYGKARSWIWTVRLVSQCCNTSTVHFSTAFSMIILLFISISVLLAHLNWEVVLMSLVKHEYKDVCFPWICTCVLFPIFLFFVSQIFYLLSSPTDTSLHLPATLIILDLDIFFKSSLQPFTFTLLCIQLHLPSKPSVLQSSLALHDCFSPSRDSWLC